MGVSWGVTAKLFLYISHPVRPAFLGNADKLNARAILLPWNTVRHSKNLCRANTKIYETNKRPIVYVSQLHYIDCNKVAISLSREHHYLEMEDMDEKSFSSITCSPQI